MESAVRLFAETRDSGMYRDVEVLDLNATATECKQKLFWMYKSCIHYPVDAHTSSNMPHVHKQLELRLHVHQKLFTET